jgi:gluconokinase
VDAVWTPRSPREVIVGLDVGTTATKAVAIGLDVPGRVVAVRAYPLRTPSPGQHVQDPHVVTAALLDALAECVSRTAGASVAALSVSTGMHGLLGLDARYQPVTPLLTWADARAADEARWLHDEGLAPSLYARSGTPVHPMSPLTKLLWFARHDPQTAQRVRWWVGLKDLVLHTLTGSLVTEVSSASGTGLLDLQTRDWSRETLALVGLDVDRLPPVRRPTQTLPLSPTVAQRVGLPAGLPVVLGAGDGPLANVGAGAIRPGVVGLSLGTSGAVRTVLPEPRLDPQARLFCYALTHDLWVLGGALSNGGVVPQWLGDVLGAVPQTDLLDLAAGVPAGSDGLVMLPYLLAERAPLWDPGLTGAFIGLQHRHGRAHLVRAAVEGVAVHLAVVVDLVDRHEPVTQVRATGGALASGLWRRVLAGALGRPVAVSTAAEGTAVGAAALGLCALGRADDLDDALALLAPATGPQAPSPAAWVEQPDPADVAAYARMRASIPQILASYEQVARSFGG